MSTLFDLMSQRTSAIGRLWFTENLKFFAAINFLKTKRLYKQASNFLLSDNQYEAINAPKLQHPCQLFNRTKQ
jgi:hypothetical protein